MNTGMVPGDVLCAQHHGGGRIPVRVFPTERDVRAIYQKPQNQGRFWRDGVLKIRRFWTGPEPSPFAPNRKLDFLFGVTVR